MRITNFSFLTPEQTRNIKLVNPISVRHLLKNNQDRAIHYISRLLKTFKSDEAIEIYWFPEPQNPCNETEHTPIETRIFNKLPELEKLELLNPQDNINSRTHFLSNFDWTDSTLEAEAK